ncbi:hypothetical protein [Streptomyces mirabilis]|uniref:hypothetical protein n=1 Tax=Streptomyces mirabilis TaxID=68239 RepID=UPI0036DDC008
MPQEMTTQEQFDAFADEVARELGTHCRTAPNDKYARGLARLIIDDEGRALNLCQPDDQQTAHLKVYAALPDDSEVQAPSIGVTDMAVYLSTGVVPKRLWVSPRNRVRDGSALSSDPEACGGTVKCAPAAAS